MGWLNRLAAGSQVRKDAELLAEEKLYAHVGNEVESGNIRPGIWTKATSLASSSNEEDIKREYIRLRVELLRAEGRLFQQFIKDVSNAADEPQSGNTQIKKQRNDDFEASDALVGFLIVAGAIILVVAILL